jgi:DNA-binding XRE family transcriptional regulator
MYVAYVGDSEIWKEVIIVHKNYKLIKAREEDLKITQEEFAKRICINKTSYVYKENGKRKIWVHEANKIVKVLNEIAKEKNLNITYNYNDIFLD